MKTCKELTQDDIVNAIAQYTGAKCIDVSIDVRPGEMNVKPSVTAKAYVDDVDALKNFVAQAGPNTTDRLLR